jgi:hypothetical protein
VQLHAHGTSVGFHKRLFTIDFSWHDAHSNALHVAFRLASNVQRAPPNKGAGAHPHEVRLNQAILLCTPLHKGIHLKDILLMVFLNENFRRLPQAAPILVVEAALHLAPITVLKIALRIVRRVALRLVLAIAPKAALHRAPRRVAVRSLHLAQ